MDVFEGASVKIETVLGDTEVRLDDPSPSPLTQMLKPRVTLQRGGVNIYRVAPYGDPTASPLRELGPMVPFIILAIVLLLLVRR